MMPFDTLEGATVYIDPLEITMVAPAYGEPPQGIAVTQWIPKLIGAQVFQRNGMKIGVKGEPRNVAADIGKAKDDARRRSLNS